MQLMHLKFKPCNQQISSCSQGKVIENTYVLHVLLSLKSNQQNKIDRNVWVCNPCYCCFSFTI